MTAPRTDWLDRLADDVIGCDCTRCLRERHERMVHDLEIKFGCRTPYLEAREHRERLGRN
jgi:hypothetical protein